MDNAKKIGLSVVLPAYLEEENLRLLLPRLKMALMHLGIAYEILVVDTKEPMDHTKAVCDEIGVRYMNRIGGNAFGDAVRTGILEAQGEFVVFMDADGSHEPEFIPELWVHKNQNGVVVASRYVAGGVTENSFLLILMSKILNIIYSLVLNIKCKDVSNSFKLYPGEKLKLLKLKCNNFDIVEEILFKLCRKFPHLQITEIPFVFRKRMFGQTKRNLFIFILTYVASLVKLRLEGRKGD